MFSCGEMCLYKNDTSWEDETLLPAKLGKETLVTQLMVQTRWARKKTGLTFHEILDFYRDPYNGLL